MFSSELIDEVAATIAVPDLVRTRRTWGDLPETSKDSYRSAAEAALRVVANHSTKVYGYRENGGIHTVGEGDRALNFSIAESRRTGEDVTVKLVTPWVTHIVKDDLPEG